MNLLKIIKGFIFFACVSSFVSYQAFAQNQKDINAKDWYCDERLELKLQAGLVSEVKPYQKDSRNALVEKFTDNGIEYETVNLVKFKAIEFETGKELSNEFEFFNVRTKASAEREFKIGEKYLFETDWLGVNHRGKGSFEYKLDFIRPNSSVKSYSQADEEIKLFKKNSNFDVFENVLGVKKNEAITVGVLAGNALNLPKPALPKGFKLRETENVKVLILVDEKGSVIKAKAICTVYPEIALSAENAAKATKFRPTLRNGEPVKVKQFLFYRFVK